MTAGLKVLLVDDKAEERAALRRLLSATELNVLVIEESGEGAEAYNLAHEFMPDIIFVSFEEPVARALKTIETLAGNTVSQVVAVSSLGDRGSLRGAMRAGAREYLVKPIKPKELARAIEDVLEEERKRKLVADSGTVRGDVFVILGPKGGIGKTSLATNLAVGLAMETQQRVAVVDLASQLGDVAMMLDIVPERTIADVSNLMAPLEPEMLESFLSTHPSGVKVLAAATEVGQNAQLSIPLVRQVVEALAKTCDYVVVDGDHLLTPLLWAVLELSTVVFLLTSTDTSSIKNTRHFLDLLTARGYREDKVKIVINHSSEQNGISPGELGRVLDYPIFWKVPHDATCSQSINLGQAFVQAHPKAKISQNVLQLARTMSGVDTRRNGFLAHVIKR